MTETRKRQTVGRHTLKGPCADCPFRNDQEPYLRPERYREIGTTLLSGQDFMCHKTVEYVEGPDGETEGQTAAKTRVCGGALATLERQGMSTQGREIERRLGLKVNDTDPNAPVYDSIAEWVSAKAGVPTVEIDGEMVHLEHCGVVGPECMDPAGYMTYNGAAESLDEPTCDPRDNCAACGSTMCEECTGSRIAHNDSMGEWLELYCIHCAEDEEE